MGISTPYPIEHQFKKRDIATAIHNDATSAGAVLYLNEDGEAVFNRDVDPRTQKVNMGPKDWRTDDWEPWAAYIEANDATFYQPEKDTVLITEAKDSAVTTIARSNEIIVINNDNMDPNPTMTEISDDLNGSTAWDCIFNINGSVNITRTMPIAVGEQSDSLTFLNYSSFELFSNDPAWIIGTKTYFFAVFRYRNVTRGAYSSRPCIIEYTTLDPADGNIRYFDYLNGATEVDRAWLSSNNSYPQVYTQTLYNPFYRNDPSFGVYHDVATNIMYVIGVPTTGSTSPTGTNGFLHHATVSIDLDDATLLTTCCNEDMSVARFMLDGEIYTFTPPEEGNFVGYTVSGYTKNNSEYVGCGPQQLFEDVATGKEYLFWACRWYETANALRYHYGILEVDRSGKTGIVKDHIQATGTLSTGAIHCCRISDSTYNTGETETINTAGHISVVKMDGSLIFFTGVIGTNVDFRRNLSPVMSYDITGDNLYTKLVDGSYGVGLGTTGSVTVGDEAATIADDVITYKFSHGAVTYELDVTIDGAEIWGDAAIRPEINTTYTDIYFDSSTLMYYIDYAGERIAPAALCAYNAGVDSSYHRQIGFIKYTVGNATSVTWHPCSPWMSHTVTSFYEIAETNWGLLTPNIWILPNLNESQYYGGQFNQAGSNEFGRCGIYPEGAFDYDPRETGNNKLQLHIIEPAVKILYDFSINEHYTSFPVTPMLRTVLLDESPLSPIADDWGKRLELSRIGHFAWVLHDNPDTARDFYAWNVMFSGPHVHTDNAVANGRKRSFYAHGLLPICSDDTYTYLSANIKNRNPANTDGMDWQVWRLNKITYALERWPDDFFKSGHSSVDCYFQQGATTYCNPDYDAWTITNYWGVASAPNATHSIFPFRALNSKYVIAGGYHTGSYYWNPTWSYYWIVYSLETGDPIGVIHNPMASHFTENMLVWAVGGTRGLLFPDATNGASIAGFRIWDYVESYGLGQITPAIGKALGPTIDGITPVVITDNGTMLYQSEVTEAHDNYVVKPAGDILGERYYDLSINDKLGIISDTVGVVNASKPHRAYYYSTSITVGATVTLALNQAVFDASKSGIIMLSASQDLNTYPLIWSFNQAGDELYLKHGSSSTVWFYFILYEWE